MRTLVLIEIFAATFIFNVLQAVAYLFLIHMMAGNIHWLPLLIVIVITMLIGTSVGDNLGAAIMILVVPGYLANFIPGREKEWRRKDTLPRVLLAIPALFTLVVISSYLMLDVRVMALIALGGQAALAGLAFLISLIFEPSPIPVR